MSAEKRGQEAQTSDSSIEYENGQDARVLGVSIEDNTGRALDFAHSQLEATHKNYDSERKHKTQTLLLTKGFHLLGWILGVFVYWLLFHDSVHDILRALIEALSCSFCQP